MQNSPDLYSIILSTFIAIGTVAVAILAIWGDLIRSKLVPPKLSIQAHNIRGTVTRFTGGPRVIYYHLRVVNSRPWSVARNCRIILRALYRRFPDQQFRPVPLPVPSQYVWAPAEFTPPVIALSTQQILDFGRVVEGGDIFEPVLYITPNNFQGFVARNEAVRYALEISADGYVAKQYQVFEVAWNGLWTDNLDQMEQNLVIREIVEQQ